MSFPAIRMRRLRRLPSLREMVAETSLEPSNFMMPYFVRHGKNIRKSIPSMPGNSQISVDILLKECSKLLDRGVKSVILFGIPRKKDSHGSEAYAEDGIIQTAVRAIRSKLPQLVICTDVCLCEYTDHGHCGVLKNGTVSNDETLKLLSKMALSHVRAGADIVAPSDMMDGRVKTIRKALDLEGFHDAIIMAYSSKFASSFYGPFRDAAESAPKSGNRKGYQMDYRNSREALREIEIDISEGADIVMVKPALSYLDIIRAARDRFKIPIAAYNVSGEYSMVKAAAKAKWINEKETALEILYSIKRAGADLIITYWAYEAALWLKK